MLEAGGVTFVVEAHWAHLVNGLRVELRTARDGGAVITVDPRPGC